MSFENNCSYDKYKCKLKIEGMEFPIVYKSNKMKRLVGNTQIYSKYKIPMLIVGETGTGKGLFAQAIHYLGENKNKEIVTIDCGTINSNLVLSEMFGHIKGAFTGAIKNKLGYFSCVGNGTIFLDEIGNQDEQFQVALLKVIETGEYSPVGLANGSKKTDARIIAATNTNLEESMEEGKFRKDLYYRLEGGYISLPPLRERMEDLPVLIKHFLKIHNSNFSKKVTLSDKAKEQLFNYDFPGNVRQLNSLIQHAVMFSPIEGCYSHFERIKSSNNNNNNNNNSSTLKSKVELYEKSLIEEALKENNYVREKTFKSLGIGKRTLGHKIKRYKIN